MKYLSHVRGASECPSTLFSCACFSRISGVARKHYLNQWDTRLVRVSIFCTSGSRRIARRMPPRCLHGNCFTRLALFDSSHQHRPVGLAIKTSPGWQCWSQARRSRPGFAACPGSSGRSRHTRCEWRQRPAPGCQCAPDRLGFAVPTPLRQ